MTHPVTPIALAFLLVYGVSVAICGILVDGTVALAFVAVALIAAIAVVLGVVLFLALGDD